MKILSLIVPAYNSEAFLEKCVSSFLAPEVLDALDIILVDDGSTDSTAAVAQNLCRRFPGSVRLIRQENRGHGGALNTGCAAAEGKYLKVIDADDWVETENLPRFVEALRNCGSDVVLTHHYTRDIGTGENKKWQTYPPEFGREYTLEEIMPLWKDFGRSLTFHGITYRTEFYRQYGISLSEHVFYEDHEYATFPCCHARSVLPMDLFLYDYRVGDVQQSVSEENQLRRLSHIETVLNRMIREYQALTCGAGGKAYAAEKIRGVLLSLLTTLLLVEPDRKRGRALAREQMARFRQEMPREAAPAVRRYRVFLLMNLAHFRRGTWERIRRSPIYRRLRHDHNFD